METGSVLVIGAGIAGITSAVELARKGISVHLVDKQATMGGQVARFGCKATDRCSKCSACVLTEKIAELKDLPSVSFHPSSEVKEIKGDSGKFRITILQRPQPIALDSCIACGLCAQECPEQCITSTLPRTFPYGYLIDQKRCRNYTGQQCHRCVEVCPTEAISFDRSSRQVELQVAAIVVATGFEPSNLRNKPQYGYGRFPNVVTGLEVEEQLGRKGRIEKPSDGQIPQDVAFIQCVGSRDSQLESGYCSQVCCAYAMRISRLLKYQSPQTNIAIHYMDIQKFGKGFDQFYAQSKGEIRFVRGLPAEVNESPD
ncbi:MAG: CoB--CoM heterodisulfide reductase iron-sulfur subunit A family protein, partial [Candidatus Latescibacteria bacterium]|nr:CoB--CoM heterodisulfide reductase iron-sulfur subunit A family protein [Candidatus Latescibacterota bacterium]